MESQRKYAPSHSVLFTSHTSQQRNVVHSVSKTHLQLIHEDQCGNRYLMADLVLITVLQDATLSTFYMFPVGWIIAADKQTLAFASFASLNARFMSQWAAEKRLLLIFTSIPKAAKITIRRCLEQCITISLHLLSIDLPDPTKDRDYLSASVCSVKASGECTVGSLISPCCMLLQCQPATLNTTAVHAAASPQPLPDNLIWMVHWDHTVGTEEMGPSLDQTAEECVGHVAAGIEL